MDNRNKKNRMSSMYDDDMDWLDDDDDYLDDGGLLESLLFGDKKKKKKRGAVSKSSSGTVEQRTAKHPAGNGEQRAARRPSGDGEQHTSNRPVGTGAQRIANRSVATPDTTVKHSGESGSVRRRKISADRTPVRLEDEKSVPERAVKSDRVQRKPAGSVGEIREYDEYYHEDSRVRRTRKEAGDRMKAGTAAGRRTAPVGRSDIKGKTSSVDNLLKEVSDLEADSRSRHEELRREAWERTQRNVAKAKAEVERLELERVQSEKEDARKQRVQQEMERRQGKNQSATVKNDQDEDAAKQSTMEIDKTAEQISQSQENVTVEQTTSPKQEGVVVDEKSAPAQEDMAVDRKSSPVQDDVTAEAESQTTDADIATESADDTSDVKAESENTDTINNNEETDKDTEDDTESGDVSKSSKKDSILDMDALERIERDIDEDRLSYSESDTADLGLGEIGRALGFDAVELEDDEDDDDDTGESDSEKFFRENLLDEADPKVVNPEKKKITISTKAWAVAFVVLLVLFVLICIIYVKNYARMKYNEMNINEISEDQILTNDGVKDTTSGYRTIALYGVDSRDSNLEAGTNSDSIIIASINESTKEIKLVSVYRDTIMQIASGAMDTTQKVNYAYQLGGAVTAINTLNTNLDLNITDYVAVDFSAMANIIDAVGGVDINIIGDEINNFNKNLAEQISLSGKYSSGVTEGGQYTLDGQQAVAYSRIRSTGKGDITRTERQRIVLVKVIQKLLAADTGSLDSFVDVSFKSISTSLNKDDIHNMVRDVSGYKVVNTIGFPFAYDTADVADKGNCVVAADLSSNVQALHKYLYDTENYNVSAKVSSISKSLEKETGVQSQNIKITTETVKDGISDGSEEEGDLKTIKNPPKGMIVEE